MTKFGELIDVNTPVLLDFFTQWNEASVSMHPVLKDVAAALAIRLRLLKLMLTKFCLSRSIKSKRFANTHRL